MRHVAGDSHAPCSGEGRAQQYQKWYCCAMSMEPVATYKRKLWRHAIDQYGFVTTRQAGQIGVPVVELAKLAHRGVLSNVAYGLYRMNDVPTTERDAFMAGKSRHPYS